MFVALRIQHGPLTRQQLANMRPQMMEFMESRPGFLAMVLPGQATFLAFALFAAWLSPQAVRDRLSLHGGQFPVWVWLVLAAATPMVGFLTSMALSLFTSDRGENMEMLQRIFRSHSGPFFAWIVVAVGVLPGICEELFFRGYVQTRLLARFPAVVAIGISAFFFSVAHPIPCTWLPFSNRRVAGHRA
jgi:membrane protease YdiL (CAAX protease family)